MLVVVVVVAFMFERIFRLNCINHLPLHQLLMLSIHIKIHAKYKVELGVFNIITRISLSSSKKKVGWKQRNREREKKKIYVIVQCKSLKLVLEWTFQNENVTNEGERCDRDGHT